MAFQLRNVSPSNSELGFVAQIVIDGSWAYASGGTYHRSTFLSSSDGATFVRRNTPVTSGLRGLLVLGGQVLVVGEYGTIGKTTDHGDTWKPVKDKQNGCLYRIEEGMGSLWVSGDDGLVLRSDDEGSTWTEAHTGGGRLLAICARDREIWFFGDQVIRFDGSSFSEVRVPKRAPLCSMAELSDGSLLLVGDSAQMFRSDDGESWESVRVPTTADLESVKLIADGVLAVGSGGAALFSDDGRNWEALELGTDEHFWSIAPGGDGALLGGNGGAIYHLHQGSETWLAGPTRSGSSKWEDFD